MSEPPDPQRFARLQALVEQGRALPLAERTAFLARAAADDVALRAEAQALLDEEARGHAAPAPAAGAPAADARAPAPGPAVAPALEPGEPDLAQHRLGSCTLTRRLAGGGMGVVYEALQEPPGRVVAVKVLRAALAGEEGRLRFEHEARVLAHLRHPGIAQIYASGTWEDPSGEALPYFVMEHVPQARSLLEHAAERRLATPARLQLFVRVCDAVHFGHTKGVIHRDLKPANVLVDGEGNPKVIDFGIARSTDLATGPGGGPRTETGMLVGTVPYMSPEQIAGAREDVDTRSDVYALGVILYELLTGRLPYDLEGLGLVEVARAICTRPPLPPSRFAPDTAGDLSVILGKALAKDPAQRYASAAALGQDVERYLGNTPIHARPPSLAYQLRLFARRHRGLVAAALVALIALLAATVVSLRSAAREAAERVEAERQRTRAESLLTQTRALVPWLLRTFSRELERLPGSTEPRSHLATRVLEHLDALAVTERDHPSVLDAAVEARAALGDVLGGMGGGHLGRRAEAEAQYTQALELLARRASEAEEAPRQGLLKARLLLARSAVRRELGRRDEAAADAAAAREAAEAQRDAGGLEAERVLVQVRTRLADLDWDAERAEPALEGYAEVLARWGAPALAGAPEAEREEGRTLAHLALAQCLLELGRSEQAQPHVAAVDAAARALEERLTAAGAPSDPGASSLLYYLHDNVGRGLLEAGHPEEAAHRFQAALRAAERRVAHDPLDAGARLQEHNAYMLLGRAAFDARRPEDALAAYARGLALSESLGASEPPTSSLLWDRRLALTQSGQALLSLGRLDEAEAHLQRARPLAEARAAALPDEVSARLGQRDVWMQLSNVSVRHSRRVLAAAGPAADAARLLAAGGVHDARRRVQALTEHLTLQTLTAARARLARARDALAACRRSPSWDDAYARDLERLEQGLAAMDEVLAAYGR